MRRIIYWLLIALSGVNVACTKIIDLKYPNSEPQLVIQANVIHEKQLAEVLVTRSSFLEEFKIDPVNDAVVRIQNMETLQETKLERVANGTYKLNSEVYSLAMVDYKMMVEVDGKSYESVCYMPKAVPIDSIKWNDDDKVRKKNKVRVFITDPAGERNYYKINVFCDGSDYSSGLMVFDDSFFNGQKYSYLININFGRDEDMDIRIELLSITKEVYQYYYELMSAGSMMNESPYNPHSNISEDVLGYFSAYSLDYREMSVRPEMN